MERRLAAILAADMVGYSRLMGRDEAGTLAAYKRHRREIINPRAAQYHGRIIKLTGDGVLMEFASVVDAVCFAVEVQLALRAVNAGRPEEAQHRYRIGINIGDIIIEEEDIYGDGVNIAARLEGLAAPGGICLSGNAFDQVKGKLDLSFEDLGAQRVKNIAEAVATYGIRLDSKAEALATPIVEATAAAPRSRRKLGMAAALLSLLLAAGLLWWQPWLPAAGPEAPAPLALPDKPSIAVLPFINVGGEAEQAHFAEGLTDDLITELSKVSGLFVIARHSVFAIKDGSGTIQDVAAELGVHYVLEGSLRRAGPRLRINVKLIDALTGLSLWAERYDREFADIFAVQDDVIDKIIQALAVKLTEREKDQLQRIPTEDLQAYDYYLRAEQEGAYFTDGETLQRALDYYWKAVRLDEGFADAHAGIARAAVEVWRNNYNKIYSAAVARQYAYRAAGTALSLDPGNARAQIVLAMMQLVDGRRVEAIQSARRAVAAQPNDPEALGNLALVLVHTGSPQEGLAELEKAFRLDPSPGPSFLQLAGVVFSVLRDYERALPLLEAARNSRPVSEPAREFLAAAFAHSGDRERARQEASSLLRLFPETNLAYYGYLYDYWRDDARRHHVEGLRKAGLPDWPFGFEGQDADRLDAAQLGELTRGKTWIGKQNKGTGFMQTFDTTGNTAYRSANAFMTGTVRVQGNRLCIRFEGSELDRRTCGYVYRNRLSDDEAEGAQAEADYVHVNPRQLKFFSLDQQ